MMSLHLAFFVLGILLSSQLIMGYPMVFDEVKSVTPRKTSKNVLMTTIEDADIDPVYFARDARAIPFKRGMKRLSLADKGMMMGLGKRAPFEYPSCPSAMH